MADEKTGSTKAKTPIILLEWNFRFWDVRKDSSDFGDDTLRGGGYGKQGAAALSKVSIAGGADTVDVPYRKQIGIGSLTFDHADQTVDLVLKAPPAHDSGREADPESDTPKSSAEWNNWVQVQMRDLKFKGLALDENGYFKVNAGQFTIAGEAVKIDAAPYAIKGAKYELVACHVPENDADAGLAHHGYAKIYPPKYSRKDKQDVQTIEVDWLFDVFRPNGNRKFIYQNKNHYFHQLFPTVAKRKDLTDAQKKTLKAAEKADADGIKEEWQDRRMYSRGRHVDPYLVIHVTGKSDITSQLQQLTSWAAIHYIVCWNGHVVKVVEDAMGCYHAGWQTPKAGWRDFVFRGSHVANRTAIGIEHMAGDGATWPVEQENASVRLVRRVCTFHDIPPCAVIRHRDLALDEPSPGAGYYLHVEGKVCPGEAVPWLRYQNEHLTLWPLGLGSGETGVPFPEGEDFFHGIFDLDSITYIDDALKATDKTPANETKQKDSIRELKRCLKLIGYWVINPAGSNEDKYDKAARDSVKMCQEKFMSLRGITPKEKGKVDRETAEVLWLVCQHVAPVLPPLRIR